ncbi:MAG: AAA family ATPase, partial [Dehalococcoidales bacterium]|nr:AAA family ATPase [Dehalococcoidales bacterium]
ILKPFARLKILDCTESHRLSSRHRGKHLSFTESRELFPELSDEEILESVKQAGEIIDQAGTSLREPEVGEPGSPDIDQVSARRDLLYRNIFVGRQTELSALTDAFDAAVAGKGSLIMIAGEPGIGKTAICEQLSNFVTSRGGATLWGHCYEEGSLSLPYLAFVEAIRSHVLDREPDDLRKELGSGASDVARIVLEIREKLNVEPREAQNPEEDRYRLFQAVSSFLASVTSLKPMCVILEDLHDADKGTLEILSFVSRNVGSTRLLLVGTYRDVEVDRSHPLSAALAELRRVSSFRRILLRGLTIDEVRRMLVGITQEDISVTVAETLHRQTEGNPLFAQEVIRYLIEEDLLTIKEGRRPTTEDTTLEMNIPEGLRDVIGKRLTLLSDECDQLLSTAAVIGREFRLELLQKVAGISDDVLINSLDEARKAAVLEERSGLGAAVTYRFTHAFFRQTLYEEMIAPRRIRLHQQVARVLEQIYANRLPEHAAELAEHFSHSSDSSDLRKAIDYGEMAAQRATDVYAYGEAARLMQQALRVQEILEPDDSTKRCDLLLSIGNTLLLAGEPRHVLENEAPEAFSLAESIGDKESAARACIMAIWARVWETAGVLQGTDEEILWAERINQYTEPDTLTCVWADIISGNLTYMKGRATRDMTLVTEGVSLLTRAVDTARRIDDVEALWVVSFYYIFYTSALKHGEERVRLAEEVVNRPRTGVSLFSHSTGLVFSGYPFLEAGKRDRAEEVWQEFLDIAKRTQQAFLAVNAAQVESQLALLDGRLDEAVEIIHNLQARGGELGLSYFIASVAHCILVRPLFHLGMADEALQLVKSVSPSPWTVAVCLAYMGCEKEAIESLERGMIDYPMVGTDQDESTAFSAICFLEAAVLLNQKQIAELLLERLRSTTVRTTAMWWLTCIPHHLGGAAALLGRCKEAQKHYQEAIKVCTEMRFRPELALSRLGLAEVLLDHYPDEKVEALEHLDFAIKEFREMKMQPSLERALRRKDILKA